MKNYFRMTLRSIAAATIIPILYGSIYLLSYYTQDKFMGYVKNNHGEDVEIVNAIDKDEVIRLSNKNNPLWNKTNSEEISDILSDTSRLYEIETRGISISIPFTDFKLYEKNIMDAKSIPDFFRD